MKKNVSVNLPIGEIVDKISILTIKRVSLSNLEKVKSIKSELIELTDTVITFLQDEKIELLFDQLIIINKNIWDVKFYMTEKEEKDEIDNFKEEYLVKSRSLNLLNNRRNEIIEKINNLTNE